MASTSTEFVIPAGHCLTFVQQRLEAFECRVCREYWTRAANAKPSKCRCDASQHSAVTDYRSYLAFRNKISNEIAHHQLVMACTVREHECKVAWHPLQPRPQPAPGPSPSPSHMFAATPHPRRQQDRHASTTHDNESTGGQEDHRASTRLVGLLGFCQITGSVQSR